jgi:hypothetical protein
MWPVTITAGVNDTLRVRVTVAASDYTATIAPGTYYSPPDLAAAIRSALVTSVPIPTVTITLLVNDLLAITDAQVGGTLMSAQLLPGTYDPASLAAHVQARLNAGSWPALHPTDPFTCTASADGVLTIRNATHAWSLDAAQPNRQGWPTVGFVTSRGFAAGADAVGETPAGGGASWSVVVSSTGRVTISWGYAFQLLLASGPAGSTSARDVLGFGAVDTASAVSATAANQMQNCWFPGESVADDTGDLDDHVRSQGFAVSGVGASRHWGTRSVREIRFAMLPPHKAFQASEGTTHLNEAFQRMLTSGWARFRWFDDATDLSTGTDYFFDLKMAKELERSRLSPGSALYSLRLSLRKLV